MPLYLPFLQDATESLAAAIAAHDTLLQAEPDKRRPRDVSGAIVNLHTAVDKALKHTLAKINPGFLLENLNSAKLHDLYLSQRASGAPSPFAQQKSFDTPNLIAVANIARQMAGKDIPGEVWTQFADSCTELTQLRNLVLHGELYGDDSLLIGALTRMLSRYRSVMAVLCPEVLAAAYDFNDQLESRLKGIENETDGAWQVLVDYLAGGPSITVPVDVYLARKPQQSVLELLLSGESLVGPSLMLLGATALSPECGLFAKDVGVESSRVWTAPREPQGLLALLDVSLDARRQEMRLGATGLVADDDGTVTFPRATGWASFELAGMKRKHISVPVVATNLTFAAQRGTESIEVHGALAPGRMLNTQKTAPTASVGGSLHMTAEIAMSADAGPWPAGTTSRTLKGPLIVALVPPPSAA